MTCNNRHDRVEHCFECSAYPCARYATPSAADSFISYRNVIADIEGARAGGLEAYRTGLDERVTILEFLIKSCNDGRRKGMYCLAANLLSLNDLRGVIEQVRQADETEGVSAVAQEDAAAAVKRRAALAVSLIQQQAAAAGVELKLRGKGSHC